MVLVPSLVGRPFSQVNTLLSEAGFRIGATDEVETEQYQTGVIISQSPSAEAQAYGTVRRGARQGDDKEGRMKATRC